MTHATTAGAETETPEPPDPLRAVKTTLATAELAECECPDSCERDHDRD